MEFVAVKERPILFNREMVRSVLSGIKTQTRRLINPQPISPGQGAYFDAYNGGPQWNWWAQDNKQYLSQIIRCPFGKPNDRLWVRETWMHIDDEGDKFDGLGTQIYYRAEQSKNSLEYARTQSLAWHPSIHMPRWASRILLEVTGVHVERVQDITEENAKNEGVGLYFEDGSSGWGQYDSTHPSDYSHRWGFKRIWDDLYSERNSWGLNPWVWVIEFKRIPMTAPNEISIKISNYGNL